MKKSILIKTLLLLSLYSNFVYSQIPEIEWHKTFGGDRDESVGRIRQTTDGGYILVGGCKSWFGPQFHNHSTTGTSDGWVLKLNSVGDTLWARMMGSTWEESFYDVVQTTDGGYIIVGRTFYGGPLNEMVEDDGDVFGYHGSGDIWVVRLDSNGSTIWTKTLGGTGGEASNSILQTSDGGFILVGYTNSSDGDVVRDPSLWFDAWLVKLTTEGEIEWQKCHGGSSTDYAMYIQHTNDGGYIVSGSTGYNNTEESCNNGEQDLWMLKMDDSGEIEWQKCYGGSNDDYAFSIIQTSDGGYLTAGQTFSQNDFIMSNGGTDVWVIKTDSEGEAIWTKAFGGSINESAYDVIETNEHGFIILASTNSSDGDITELNGLADIWLIMLDSNGELIGQKTLGGSEVESGYSIDQTSDGGYIISGVSNTWDDFIQVGGADNTNDIWIVKLSPIVNILEVDSFTFSLFPNPATNNITISNIERGSTITIHDITGKLFHQSVINDVQTIIDIKQLSSGVYTVQVRNDNRVATEKLVVE